MKIRLTLVLLAASLLSAALPAAAEFNFAATLVGALPIGTFAEKDGIIGAAPYGWRAVGGGAETGFGFNLELETRVGKVTWVGLRFGYVKHGADAGDLMRYINSLPDTSAAPEEITAMEGDWTETFISVPVRFIAREFRTGSTYLRFDIGWAKVTGTYDGTVRYEDPPAEETFTSEFKFGNQFFLAGGVGVDFMVGESLSIVAEAGYCRIFLSGAEATGAVGPRTVNSIQDFDIQTVEFALGVRIPLGGI